MLNSSPPLSSPIVQVDRTDRTDRKGTIIPPYLNTLPGTLSDNTHGTPSGVVTPSTPPTINPTLSTLPIQLTRSQQIALARTSPAAYASIVSEGRWKLAPHLQLINRCLIDAILRRRRKFMFFVPPRHGKSEFISQYFPSYYLGLFPDERGILTSYEADFAAYWGRRSRDIFTTHSPEIWGLNISRDSSAVNRWDIENHLGGLQTAGVGGPITGKGANFLIIDDPIKNAAEAASETKRNSIYDWYLSTALTRLEPNGIILFVMTRWHQDDLAGRILKEEKDWTVIRIPALSEGKNDLLNRPKGKALWPERYDEKALNERRQKLGPYFWTALYGGRPGNPKGQVFKEKWFTYYKEDDSHYILGDRSYLKNKCYIFQTVDTAVGKKSTNDYFVVMTLAVTPDKDILILDLFRARIGADGFESTLTKLNFRWRPLVQYVEDYTFGTVIVQQLADKLPIMPVKVDADKLTRSMTAQARYSMGKIFHPLAADGRKDEAIKTFETELKEFPTGEHDDQVDCISYAAITVMTQGVPDAN